MATRLSTLCICREISPFTKYIEQCLDRIYAFEIHLLNAIHTRSSWCKEAKIYKNIGWILCKAIKHSYYDEESFGDENSVHHLLSHAHKIKKLFVVLMCSLKSNGIIFGLFSYIWSLYGWSVLVLCVNFVLM